MFDFSPLATIDGMLSLLTLTLLEIVLGVDNIIFISILASKLPEHNQQKARNIGLSLALFVRLLLLSMIVYIITWTQPLFTLAEVEFSIRDLILIGGGLFLIYKSTMEIHHRLEGADENPQKVKKVSLGMVIVQIILLDIVFSFDSILTAIGLVDHLTVMMMAVVISMIFMLIFVKKISDFIITHPTVKMLALSFLLMIGMLLILEGFHQHVAKGYVYYAIGFSLFVEMLNLRAKKKQKPVVLKTPYPAPNNLLEDEKHEKNDQ